MQLPHRPKTIAILIRARAFLAVTATFCWLSSSHAAWQIQDLPDTGQTTTYTATFGEDGDYTINPPEYTDNGDTISDEVTGLVWQQDELVTTATVNAASTYCDELVLGTDEDWRLPSSHELFSLVDFSTSNPPLNSTYFPDSASGDYWWSVTPRVDDSAFYWAVNGGGGIGPKPEDEAQIEDFWVRCVRDDSSIKVTPDFTDNADGTVTEHNTGLTWQQDGATSMTWEAALTQCEGLTLADHEDWRLPNIKELRSISDDDSLWNPSVSTTYFTLTTTAPPITTAYWSSTTRENETTEAWFVDFYYGLVSHTAKTGTGYVLCVRSSGIFADGFESGNTSAWTATVP